jgi:hypothetical protein
MLIYIRILMSTIAPKLSEFVMNTYSFPCSRVKKEKNVICMDKLDEQLEQIIFSSDFKPVTITNQACRCSSVTGICHHEQEGT